MEKLIIEAMAFQNMVNDFNIDRDYDELYYKKSRENYNMIVNRLKNIDLPDIDSFLYTDITLFEMFDILEELMNKILGNKFNNKIRKLAKKVVLDSKTEVYLGYTYVKVRENGIKVDSIHISNDLVNIEIVTLAHEYMHAILSKYIDEYYEVLTNFHYDELLSILVEYIVCYELSKIFKKDKLVPKNEIARLKILSEAHFKLNEAEKQCFFEEVTDYIRHTVYGYTVSEVYATRLMDIFRKDSGIIYDIREIARGKYSIGDMLEDNNISLEDDKTVNTFVKKLERYDKIKM